MVYDMNATEDTLPNEVFNFDEAEGTEESVNLPEEPSLETEAPTPASTKHKVKIDGQELEIDLEELKAGYQQAKSSQKAFQDAAKLKDEVIQLVNMIKQDPISVMNRLNIDMKSLIKSSGYTARELIESFGDDPSEIAAALLQERIEEEMMTPEQKKAKEWDKYQETEKQKLQKQREEYEAYLVQQEQQKVADELQTEILGAISAAGVKPSRELLAQVANEMMIFENAGRSISAEKAMSNIKARHQEQLQLLLKNGNIAELEKILPKEVIEQYNKNRLASRKNEFVKDAAKPKEGSNRRQYRTLDELLED